MVSDSYRTINSRILRRPLSWHHHHAATVGAFKAAGRDGRAGRAAGRRASLRPAVPRRPRRSPHAAPAARHTPQCSDKNITEKCYPTVPTCGDPEPRNSLCVHLGLRRKVTDRCR